MVTAMLEVTPTVKVVLPASRSAGMSRITVTASLRTLPDLAMNFSMPCSWTG